MNKEQAEFQRLWNKIGSSGIMILSTCADIRVTSRAMSVVVIDGKFYCQTALAIISLCALQGYLQILPQKTNTTVSTKIRWCCHIRCN